MKTILHCLLLLFVFSSGKIYAGEKKECILGTYKIVKTSKMKSMEGKSVFTFTFFDQSGTQQNKDIKVSANGKALTVNFTKEKKYSFQTTPGKFKFVFSSDNFKSITTDSIQIGSSDKTEIRVDFESNEPRVICEKPVIYLYPEKTTDINIHLDFKGEILFTYPQLNENNSWKVTAHPDGTLSSEGKTFNYLFWEGNTNKIADAVNESEGFMVEKNDLLAFLENNLAAIGLNSKEAQDFITYWYPQMMNNEKTFIRFVFNEKYDQYAKLTVTPVPDQMIRVFMLWSPADDVTMLWKPQIFPAFERKGFTLVEWGGAKTELKEAYLHRNK